jgi:hypothetical protein
MGLAGMGAGHQIITRDIPVPIWAGDGLLSPSTTMAVPLLTTHHLVAK